MVNRGRVEGFEYNFAFFLAFFHCFGRVVSFWWCIFALKLKMNPKINSTNYERECFEFGDGYHRDCRNDVHRSGAVMHLNAHKIQFCLHMSEKSSNFAVDFDMCIFGTTQEHKRL